MTATISTGVSGLDTLIGVGGYPIGMVTEVSGPKTWVDALLSKASPVFVRGPDLRPALASRTKVVVWQTPAAFGRAQIVADLFPHVMRWLDGSDKALVVAQYDEEDDVTIVKYLAMLRIKARAEYLKIIKNMLFASAGHTLRDWT